MFFLIVVMSSLLLTTTTTTAAAATGTPPRGIIIPVAAAFVPSSRLLVVRKENHDHPQGEQPVLLLPSFPAASSSGCSSSVLAAAAAAAAATTTNNDVAIGGGGGGGGSIVPSDIQDVWGMTPNLSNFPGANFPAVGTPGSGSSSHHHDDGNPSGESPNPNRPPPILEIPNFLSSDECRQVQDWAKYSIENGAPECDDYLNYRVNKEVQNDGISNEGKILIDEFDLDKGTLSASDHGGFRIRLDDEFVQQLLETRVLDLLNMQQRHFVFEDGLWIRPTPRTVCVRDKTVVLYGENHGVPPHVDGKDATLLVYLTDVPDGVGGRTVFPEDGYAQTPVEGTALLYRSMTELLHYSEAMQGTDNEKWIMQLLLDFNHDYKVGDTITDFRTGQSYIWDGS